MDRLWTTPTLPRQQLAGRLLRTTLVAEIKNGDTVVVLAVADNNMKKWIHAVPALVLIMMSWDRFSASSGLSFSLSTSVWTSVFLFCFFVVNRICHVHLCVVLRSTTYYL
jgi:hypothetical protein